MKKVAVLGDGAWGTAIATLLAHNGHQVSLWCNELSDAKTIEQMHRNERYLPGVDLSERITPTASLEEALRDTRWIFEAVPVQYLRSILIKAAPFRSDDHVWVILSKGLEQKTLLLPAQIIDATLGANVKKAVLAGPSFAADLAQKKVTGVSIAATEDALIRELQDLVDNDYFKTFASNDFIGLQIGGAIKNVITIGVGMLDGAGYTDNTKAFLVTRGLYEMEQIAAALGGKAATLYGLSGIGDLMLTSLGHLSRNLAVGKRLGRGDALQTILDELGHVPEGINTVQSIQQLAEQKQLKLPICSAIHEIVFAGKKIDHLIAALMQDSSIT